VPHSASTDAIRQIRSFQSETADIREAPEPAWARATVHILAAFFVVAILIMCVTRVDRVVSSTGGKIVSTEPVNVYQALDTSIIKSIDVREGDEVSAGQLLATLDPTFASADVKQLAQQIASLQTQVARDEAELDGRPLAFPVSSDPDFLRYAALQKSYYDQQVAEYQAQLASFAAKQAETEATIEKYQQDEARYRDRADVAQQIEGMRTTLEAHGNGSKLDLLDSQDQRIDLQRSYEFSHNSLIEAQHTLASVIADRDAFVKQWQATVSQDLLTARNNLDAASAQLEKATRHRDLVRLAAREPSVVLTLAPLSVGSVLKEGDSLMTLMPANAPVEAEIQIASRDVGFVRPGDTCVLKIGAFNYMEHGTAEGTIRWISDNAFTTDDDGKPVSAYYKARCSVAASHFVNVPTKFRLIPGMTLGADLKVGTRSVAMYVLGGVLRGVSEAMREP
jgi:HlyD family secretion protein